MGRQVSEQSPPLPLPFLHAIFPGHGGGSLYPAGFLCGDGDVRGREYLAGDGVVGTGEGDEIEEGGAWGWNGKMHADGQKKR